MSTPFVRMTIAGLIQIQNTKASRERITGMNRILPFRVQPLLNEDSPGTQPFYKCY
jgi:hypothetical protein